MISPAERQSVAAATPPGSRWFWSTSAVVSSRSRPGSPTVAALTAATAAEIESWPLRWKVDEFELRQPPN